MTRMTYTNLINKTLELYLQKDYLKAYNFITENTMKVKGNNAQIYNFRYSIASKAGLNDLAMKIMREAILEKGYWYSYDYLLEDDDLKPLYEYNDFEELANICKEREIQSQRDCKPDLKVLMPNNLVDNEKYPLIIALHGNQENILITEDYWSPCVMNRRILALPQSSHIEFSDAYSWNDINKGTKEIKEHYKMILKGYNVDSENIIIGGFSAGARIALYAVLNDVIQVKGFIFVGPWLPEIEEWEHLLDGLKLKGIKGYIFCGDKDKDCFEGSNKFADMLNQRNIPNIFKVVEGLNHDYPTNFDKELEEAIKFITK
ncbi:MAG: alpha/beta hydrolase [Thermosipho sp. (in: Bacteria)]|nr:alpha/beta hydrolase [Thermosipho sp. (in: thermotogales)]